MTTQQTDDEIAAIYRTASREEPGTDLDARILAAAHRQAAIRARDKTPAGSAWWRRLRIPVSVTAIVVLGISLSYRVNEEARLREQQSIDGSAATAGGPPAVSSSKPGPAEPSRSPHIRDEARAQNESETAKALRDQPPPALPATPLTRATATDKTTEQAFPSSSVVVTQEVESRRDAEPSSADSLEASARRAERSVVRQRHDSTDHTYFNAQAEKKSAAATAGALSKPAAAPTVKETANQEVDSDAHQASPERWLEHIRRLRREGKANAANEEVRRFLERYPDVPLPPDLR